MARREEVTTVKLLVRIQGDEWRVAEARLDEIASCLAVAGYQVVLSEDWSRLGRDALVGARIRRGESYEVQEGTVPPWMEQVPPPESTYGNYSHQGERWYRLRPLTDEASDG